MKSPVVVLNLELIQFVWDDNNNNNNDNNTSTYNNNENSNNENNTTTNNNNINTNDANDNNNDYVYRAPYIKIPRYFYINIAKENIQKYIEYILCAISCDVTDMCTQICKVPAY